MKKIIIKYFCCYLFLFPIIIVAQNVNFKKYTTSDGLMSNQVEALFLDSKGQLWIFNGNGITRFNGQEFKNYLNDSMLTEVNKVNAFSIKELEDGSIFYSMKYGYAKTSKKKPYYLDIFLSDTLALKEENGVSDKNGIQYFKKGYLNFDFKQLKVTNKVFESYPDNFSFPSNLLCSNQGNVFYSFYNKGNDTRTLYLYKNKSFTKVYDDVPFIVAGILEFGNYYYILPEEFNDHQPIILVNKNNFFKTFIKKNKEIPSLEFIGNGFIDNGNIVLPTTNGVLVISPKNEQIFIKEELNKLNKESGWPSLNKPLYKFFNYIINGYRWIDLNSKKIFIIEPLLDLLKKEVTIKEAIPDLEGNLWYATYDGLLQINLLPYNYLYDITEDRIAEINDSIENNRFKCISNDLKNIEFCLTNDSENVQILIPEIKDKFYKYDLNSKKISEIYVQGLFSPILRERLYPLLSYKKLLICQEYTRGLVIYHLNATLDTAYYHLWNYSNGLLSNYIENIFVDKKENFWLITWDGIQLIQYNDLINENYEYSIKYSQSFKLDMIPFMKDAEIYFADGKKLFSINTDKVYLNQKPPEIIIDKITYKLENKQFEIQFKKDSLYEIPYNFEELNVEFYAVCLTDGKKVQYKYVLDGNNHFQKEGKIVLNDLKSGIHTLEIYASNNINIWNKVPVVIQFEILPPFWERWWFRILFISLFSSIILLIIKYREKELKKQKRKLENIVKERTKELEEKNILIQQKNTEILDSINYAKRLQKSSVPSEAEVKKIFPNSFVLYMPKDIVAGDFYFAGIIRTNDGNELKGIAVGDCTGHGVPGAFMSILTLAYVKQSLVERDVNSPAEALEFISKKIQKVLEYKNKEDEVKDSADMVFAVFDKEMTKLWCACANNPIYIVRNKELIEIPAQKRTVGYCDNNDPFINHTLELQKDDTIYFFTDGYADQFGGKKYFPNSTKDKKFTKKRLKDTLIAIAHLDVEQQKEELIKIHSDWKENSEQTDDICIIGIKII